MKKSLNLNELLFPQNFNSLSNIVKGVENKTGDSFNRIYLGSNFCSQYFLAIANFLTNHLKVLDINLPITLTVPIFSEKNLKSAKKLILELLAKIENIDELTVNDLGMLNFLKNDYPVNLGRLFFKDTRDFRVEEYSLQENFPNLSEFVQVFEPISGVELDNITQKIDLGRFPKKLTISVHYPYTYQSTGNICKFASIKKPVNKKFRPNDSCNLNCSNIYEHYRELFGEKENIDENLTDIFRQGRTIYFLNGNIEYFNREPDRFIYFPLTELMNNK